MVRGETKETRGTAFVVYEDIYDAKDAVDHLSGFNVGRAVKTADTKKREQEIEELKAKFGLAK